MAANICAARLLDLGFFEFDVLARHRIIFAEAQLLGDVARILLRHIEKAGISRADELDLDGCWLGHDSLLSFAKVKKIGRHRSRRLLRVPLPPVLPSVKPSVP